MKTIKYLIALIMILSFYKDNLLAQPYIYHQGKLTDSISLKKQNWEYSINRYNLKKGTDEIFKYYGSNFSLLTWDPNQNWLIADYYSDGPSLIYNCLDTLNNFELAENIAGNGETFLYSKEKNRIYIIAYYYNEVNIEPSSTLLIAIDMLNHQIVNRTPIYVGEHNVEYEKMFFSSDGSNIFIPCTDSTTRKHKIIIYSTLTDQIISTIDISLIGFPNADVYLVNDGKNGKGIIESYFRSSIKSYYRVYDFVNNSISNFIIHNGDANTFLINNGERILAAEYAIINHEKLYTGKIFIYDVVSTNLLKTFNLPHKGELHIFDNYPNNLYYVKDIELPTRQIYILKTDSIFNELDLSSIIPSTVNLNSPTSTLTVKGKGFDTLSAVFFNGQKRTTTFISDSVITAQILSSDVSVAGTFPVWVKDEWSISDTLHFIVQPSSPNLLVNLKSSTGTLLNTGALQYYEGSWKDAINNGDGTFTVITELNSVSLRMTYEYSSQTVSNISAHNNNYTFQTVNAQVQLQNSLGVLIDSGSVQYYAGAWRSFGSTVNGVASKELLPINYSFRMNYAYASKDKQQDLSTNPIVVFQTVAANVKLQNSSGDLIDLGTVQYYSGAWRTFGNTSNGIAVKELLPNNYSFRMTYAFASKDKQQDLNSNPTVIFQTVAANVELRNSAGILITETAAVQYYSGAWREFATTNNGVAVRELLPNSYSFRMNYAFASKDKQQDLNANPIVIFQTVAANVQLQNSSGNFIDEGIVQYYSGAWRAFGPTSNGIAVKELLPNNYTFRMNYAFASKDKQQDIGSNRTVVFQTVSANVVLQNSAGNPIDPGTVQYYSGAWRDFGATTNGIATKELLPNNYSFRMTYAYASKDKQQDLNTNPIVVFQTVAVNVQLQNSVGNLIDQGTVQYYSGAWREFGTTTNGVVIKELLPNNYSFRMTYEYISNDKSQDISANSVIVFPTVLCTVKVKDSQNQPVDDALASYYSGAWRQIGNTINGEITKELLPANLNFRIQKQDVQQNKTQNIGTNNLVEFTLP
ncbi:MAG: hypothetical protein C4539_09255 [Ignavibacteriales bacterium]|nr:MAG: hypothetical protein C4539_09255 [Ignavibacteriales bacterium]